MEDSYNGYKMVNGRKMSADGFVCGDETSVLPYRRCVAVKITDNEVLIRDTKDTTNTTLRFTHEEWRVFTSAIGKGEFHV